MAPSRNLFVMSLSFMVLFSAYNTLQNYATSLFPNGLGNQSLAVLYVTCALSVFTAPAFVDVWGPRLSMVIGAACYVVYMISLIQIIPAVVLGMSAVIGWGAAVLWVANGVYITMDSTPAEYAEATATFWAVFQICNVAGNLATYAVFPHLTSTSALYIGFAVVGAVGTAGLAALGPPRATASSAAATSAVTAAGVPRRARMSFGQHVRALGRGAKAAALLLCDWRMACVLPLFFFSGYELAFWTGAFPQLLSPSVIGLVLTAAGTGEVLGAYLMGWVSDRVGRTVSLALGSAFFAVGLGVAAAMHNGVYVGESLGGAPLGAYAAALGFGLGDSSFNTNAYAMCSQLHGNKKEGAANEGGGVGGGRGGGGGEGKRGHRRGGVAGRDEEEGLLGAGALSERPHEEGMGGGAPVRGAPVRGLPGGADPDPSAGSSGASSVTSDPASGSGKSAPGGGGGDDGGADGAFGDGGGGSAMDGTTTDGSASVGAFAVFQLLQNMGSALGFGLGLVWPLVDLTDSNGNVTARGSMGQVWLTSALLVLSVVAFAVVDASERAKKRRDKEAEEERHLRGEE